MSTVTATGRTFGGKTAGERRAERRAQLILAAVKVYGERGYRNATVKAVCDAAGLTERYFYESFANSEDLLCACFKHGSEALVAKVRRAALACHGTWPERARASLLVYLRYLRDDPALARVFLIEMASVSPRADQLVGESLDQFGALLVDLLAEDPGLSHDFSRLLLRGVIGGGLHVAQAWIEDGYAEDIEFVADAALRLYTLVARNAAS